MKRIWIWVLVAGAAVLATFFVAGGPKLIQIASGATSQNICSKTFVSGVSADEVYAQDMRPEPGMGLIDWALSYQVDRTAKSVSTSVFGTFRSHAIYREGYGCVLVYHSSKHLKLPPLPVIGTPPTETIAGPEVVHAQDPRLVRALDRAFVEPETGERRWTQAVVVVHRGRVIAERYASGYGVETPLLSHSIAKSVLNALVGILARDGKLSAASIAPSLRWQSDGDAGDAVSMDQLLRMSSGLPLDEGMGPGLAQRMWFVESDKAAFAAKTPLASPPGTAWAYSNLGYELASRIVADTIGGGPPEIAAFARRELFAPLGMQHALIEFDGAGTPSGSNAMFATAREWAKFGLLYLNDGVVDGRRVLPEGWVKYSTTPTLGMGYGAGFWLNTTDRAMPVWGGRPWGMPGAPRDAYFARGYLGQYIVIVPSENLVVVRFGASHIRGGDIEGVGALVHDVIETLHAPR